MKKVIQINIGGIPFTFDDDAYKLINEYLESLNSYFAKDEESGKEIIEDIENRLAELFISKISDKKQVINIEDVNEIIKTLGKIDEFEFEEDTNSKNYENTPYNRKYYRKLFRDPDQSYLGGVCGGLSLYFHFDPLWIRLIFLALIFANGFGVLLYAILWVIVPKAKTTAERLQMKGEPVTVETIKKSVNDEYHKVKTSLNNMKNSNGYNQGRNVAEKLLNAIGQIIIVFFKIIVFFIGFVFLMLGIVLLIGLSTAIFVKYQWFHTGKWSDFYLPELSDFFSDPTSFTIVAVCLLIVLVIPIIALIIAGINLLLNIRTRNKVLGITAFTAWILALIILIAMVLSEGEKFTFRSMNAATIDLNPVHAKTLTLKMTDKDGSNEKMTFYSFFNFDFYYNQSNNKLLKKPSLEIINGEEINYPQLIIKRSLRNIHMNNAEDQLESIEYNWSQMDSVILFDNYFSVSEKKWMFPKVNLVLKIPENQKIVISSELNHIITNESLTEQNKSGKKWQMSEDGLKQIID